MADLDTAAITVQWESLVPHIDEHLVELNNALRNSTFVVPNSVKPSEIDNKLFNAVKPLIPELLSDNTKISNNRHIIRWFDFLQNQDTCNDEKIKIDLNIKLEREIKEKPKKVSGKDSKAEPVEKESKDTQKKESQPPKGKPTDPEAIAKAKAAKEAKKAAKAKANAEAQAKAKAEQVPPNPSMIDIRVGFIEKAIKHPDADALYVSTIQMGDEDGNPRTVCSGLVKHFELEEMQKRYVIVIANLKPVTMRGIKSSAMVLCASNEDGKVEFVNPPAGSKPGDKIFFQGFDGTPEKVLNPKKKIWETVQPHFTTTDDFAVVYKEEGKADAYLVNKANEICRCTSLANAQVR